VRASRIALIHNLPPGGARRAMHEQQSRLGGEVLEFCLQTATPVTASPRVTAFAPVSPRVRPLIRPLPRHLDLAALCLAWRRLARAVNEAECDAVLAHPCQYIQAPPALLWLQPGSVYFCHEPRRVDYEPAAAARVNPRTRYLYAGLHRAERGLDRAGVAAAGGLLTNSRFTAARIERAYGRTGSVIPLGVADVFTGPVAQRERAHLLSVGTLIAGKGHDRAIAAVAQAERRWPLIVVAPRPQPEEQSRLQALSRQSGVALEVRVGVTDEELRDLYQGAVATLYLAREEPFGLASLEAQACGSPVVVADEGGLPETMVSGQTGWAVAREDARAAGEAIDAVARVDALAGFSRRAREHAITHTWAACAEAVQEALDEAAARR